MTETRDHGGPATSVFGGQHVYSHGMLLRDWFAGQALAGFLADGSQRLICKAIEDSAESELVADSEAMTKIINHQLSLGCYAIADAMLAARKK